MTAFSLLQLEPGHQTWYALRLHSYDRSRDDEAEHPRAGDLCSGQMTDYPLYGERPLTQCIMRHIGDGIYIGPIRRTPVESQEVV